MTRREEIIALLSKGELSAQQISNQFKVELKEILEDLGHIKISIRPKKLISKPAFCKYCSFIFKERSKVKKPSKCPKCKSEWIQPQLFSIK